MLFAYIHFHFAFTWKRVEVTYCLIPAGGTLWVGTVCVLFVLSLVWLKQCAIASITTITKICAYLKFTVC